MERTGNGVQRVSRERFGSNLVDAGISQFPTSGLQRGWRRFVPTAHHKAASHFCNGRIAPLGLAKYPASTPLTQAIL
jgi:hypothetical protein